MTLDGWLEKIENIHPVGWDLGLDRVGAVGEKLGVLHPGRKVVLVAGTNGKGSTCRYLAEIAQASGLSVGVSSSPHLFKFNERISINGQPVSDDLIVQAFETIERERADISLTYFEFASLASMLIFQEANLDLTILEIGLGGRLDAMNIVDPDLCIIMSVDLDHQSWLGNTREEIGREKAGILRHAVPLVLGDATPPSSVLEVAASLEVPTLSVGKDFSIEQDFQYSLPALSFAAARQAAELLGMNLPMDEYAGIAASTELLGRKTWRQATCAVLLDVAHNPAAARHLAEYVCELEVEGDIHVLVGIYADKDIDGVLAPLEGQVKNWHLTDMNEARAASATEIADHLAEDRVGSVHTYAKISAAIEALVDLSKPSDLILVVGSFAVVAGALEYLDQLQSKA